eukprot:Opistho-2@54078
MAPMRLHTLSASAALSLTVVAAAVSVASADVGVGINVTATGYVTAFTTHKRPSAVGASVGTIGGLIFGFLCVFGFAYARRWYYAPRRPKPKKSRVAPAKGDVEAPAHSKAAKGVPWSEDSPLGSSGVVVVDVEEESTSAIVPHLEDLKEGESIVRALFLDDPFIAEAIFQRDDYRELVAVEEELQREKEQAYVERMKHTLQMLKQKGKLGQDEVGSFLADFEKNIRDIDAKWSGECERRVLAIRNGSLEREAVLEREIQIRSEVMRERNIALKKTHDAALEAAASAAELTSDETDDLLHTHAKDAATLDRLMHEESVRQQALLNDKMFARVAFARMHRAVAEQESEKDRLWRGELQNALDTLLADGKIDSHTAASLLSRADSSYRAETEVVQEKLHVTQEELSKELTSRQSSEVDTILEEHRRLRSEDANRPRKVDPSTYVRLRHALIRQQRMDLRELERRLDQAASDRASEVMDAHYAALAAVRERLGKQILSSACEGDAAAVESVLTGHQDAMQRVQNAFAGERDRQQKALQERLAARAAGRESQRQSDGDAEEDVGQQQTDLVEKLLESQSGLSDKDRERILFEHQRQMMDLSNALGASRLKQRKVLEQKLAEKRAAKLAAIASRQKNETVIAAQGGGNAGSLLEKHSEERAVVLKELEEERAVALAQLRDVMEAETEAALRRQENELSALLAKYQVEKARRLQLIEEQRKAMSTLQSRLMETLTRDGSAVDTEDDVLQKHKEGLERLETAITQQRAQQWQALQEKLKEKQRVKEAQLRSEMERAASSERKRHELMGTVRTAAFRFQMLLLQKRHREQVAAAKEDHDLRLKREMSEMQSAMERTKEEALMHQQKLLLSALAVVAKMSEKELDALAVDVFKTKAAPQRELRKSLKKGHRRMTQKKEQIAATLERSMTVVSNMAARVVATGEDSLGSRTSSAASDDQENAEKTAAMTALVESDLASAEKRD